MTSPISYASTAERLVERIMRLDRAKVLACDDPWKLLDLGLKCDDLGLSLFQASWALRAAQERLRKEGA